MNVPPPLSQRLQFHLSQDEMTVLPGLEEWLRLGLITDSQVRDLSANVLNCAIYATLHPDLSHPELLNGLETWIRLGLVSEAEVLSFSADCLSQAIPVRVAEHAPPILPQMVSPVLEPLKTGWRPQVLKALMDEFSVLWLLFLGVFLVVVSSAVLAASQWQSVPPAGQYGILFGYTLAFWGVSVWVHRRENLQLTAHTLQLTTLLIIPVNFWMIDAFKLLKGGLEIGVAIAAGFMLTFVAGKILKPQERQRWSLIGVKEDANPGAGWVCFFNFVLLCWVHWGWSQTGIGFVAVYVGVIATSLGFLYQQLRWLKMPESPRLRASGAVSSRVNGLWGYTPLFAGALLLFRATVIAKLPLATMALAIAIAGWIFCWAARRAPMFQSGWLLLGGCLLLAGRGITLEFPNPIQAVAITLLALWILGDRLLQSGRSLDLGLLFGIGLQGLYPLYEIIPEPTRAWLVMRVTDLVGAQGMPMAMVSVLGLPYVWMTLWGSDWLRLQSRFQRLVTAPTPAQSKPTSLAVQGEQLALGLGTLLALLSLGNPSLRVVYLGLGFMTLVHRCWIHRKTSPPLAYLTHGVGLAAIASAILAWAPPLGIQTWASLCLGGMLLAWGYSTVSQATVWQQSSWRYGLVLAGIGYFALEPLTHLFVSSWSQSGSWPVSLPSAEWGAIAWTIPTGLMLVAYRSLPPKAHNAQWLAVWSIPLVQWLCLRSVEPRLIGFSLGTVLMTGLALRLKSFGPVFLSLGFGGLLIGNVAWELGLEQHPKWIIVGLAILGISLGLICFKLKDAQTLVFTLYHRASQGWSILLDSLSTLVLSWVAIFSLSGATNPDGVFFGGATLTAIGAGIRVWSFPSPWALCGFLVTFEVWLGIGAVFTQQPFDTIAQGTIIAGFILVFMGRLADRLRQSISPPLWDFLPLVLGGIGGVLGHHAFQGYTGLYTMAAALIALGIGRRSAQYQGLSFLGLAALSFGVYELLVYQLMQRSGEHTGDALILFGALTTAVAVGDRLMARWSPGLFNLSQRQFIPVAHVHWLLGLVFLMTALLFPLSALGEWAWMSLMIVLSAYALGAGRTESGFIYWGISTLLAVLGFGLMQLLPVAQLLHWSGAIASLIALGCYYLPWNRAGLKQLPGQQMAMILPMGVVTLSWLKSGFSPIGLSSLFLSGGWYVWVSQQSQQIRLSYLGVGFGGWAMLRLIDQTLGVTPLWWAFFLAAFIMFIAQVEPLLQGNQRKELRHGLRCIALGLLALMALNESDGSLGWSFSMLLASLGVGFFGIVFKVRACLYVGTLAFLVKIMRILWLFVANYSLLLWAIGIILGLLLIWLAATFESRRTQAIAFLDYWSNTLEQWQ